MTYSEAIKQIKRKICCEKLIGGYCTENCRYVYGQCEFRMAINSMKKQIPMKPIKEDEIGVYTRTNIKCKKPIYDNNLWICRYCCRRDAILNEGQNYCHICGQRIDWNNLQVGEQHE